MRLLAASLLRPLLCLSLALLLAGCDFGRPSEPATPPPRVTPLSIAVIDDQPLAEAIGRELSARSDRETRVEAVSSEKLLAQSRQLHDVLIYPPAMMGELIKRQWIVPLPAQWTSLEGEPVRGEDALADVAKALRQTELRWGTKTYALPLGSPVLTLMVRADLLDQIDLEVPQTWQQYQQAVETIQQSDLLKENGTLAAATLEPLADAYLPELWLARSAAYVKHSENLSTYFDYATGEARIASPGFVRAAEELAAIAATIPEELHSLGPQGTAEAFLAGRSVMAIGWITSATEVADEVPADITFAPLPGSVEIYRANEDRWASTDDTTGPSVPLLSTAGMVGSISATSGDTLAAAAILGSLSGEELAPLVSPASGNTTLFRTASLPQAEAWLRGKLPGTALRQYAQLTLEQLQSTRHLPTIRLPRRTDYLEATRSALKAILETKEVDPTGPLSDAAEIWNTLANQQGQQHVQMFRNSQGIGDSAF